jgi:hypothetical protein
MRLPRRWRPQPGERWYVSPNRHPRDCAGCNVAPYAHRQAEAQRRQAMPSFSRADVIATALLFAAGLLALWGWAGR